jgi:hypothetical protein
MVKIYLGRKQVMPLKFVTRRDAVAVYRPVPRANKPKPELVLLGSFSRHDFLFRPSPKVTMTEDETAEAEGYRVYLQLRDEIRQKLAAHQIEETMQDVLAYFAAVDDPTERSLLRQQMSSALRMLQRALRPA